MVNILVTIFACIVFIKMKLTTLDFSLNFGLENIIFKLRKTDVDYLSLGNENYLYFSTRQS